MKYLVNEETIYGYNRLLKFWIMYFSLSCKEYDLEHQRNKFTMMTVK